MYVPYDLATVRQSADRKLFTVIDTFAGGGGTSTGMKLAGGHELLVNEFVKEAVDAFKVNYPDVPVIHEDIKKLTGADFLSAAGIEKGELDILSGSPPCSAFSINGSRDKGWGKTKNYSTGKKVENIEDLFFEYLRVADEIKPRVIIAENVKGLTVGKAESYMNQILNELRSMGYVPSVKLLKACDFDTPQTRERCFFIAVREDIAKELKINFFNVGKLFPRGTTQVCTLREGFANLEQDPEDIKWHLEKFKTISKYQYVVDHMPKDPKKLVCLSQAAGIDKFFNCYRQSWYHPCNTLTVVGSAPSLSNFIHPDQDRPLTVPEFKRVMGLPDDYYCGDKLEHQYERIARMVAPRVMEAIANSVYEKVLCRTKI